jgi:hypothetical protein
MIAQEAKPDEEIDESTLNGIKCASSKEALDPAAKNPKKIFS